MYSKIKRSVPCGSLHDVGAAAGAKAGASAALGAGAGNLSERALTGASGFGGVGSLSTGGAAFGASIDEAGSAATAALGNAVVNQVPGAVDAVSSSIQDAGQAINNRVSQAIEQMQPEPMIDLDDR